MPIRRALLATAILAPVAARAQPAAPAMRDAIRRAVAEHILPRHRAFAAAARDFAAAAAWVEAAGPEPARAAWTRAVVLFQGTRHLRFGPMEAFDRGFRLAFFPDPRNAVAREMAELLRATNPEATSQAAFARGRVAAQGLPAAERLLFGEDAPRLLATDGQPRRALLAAIGRNVATIATELDAAWTGPEAYGRGLEGGSAIYRTPQDGLDADARALVAMQHKGQRHERPPLLAVADEAGVEPVVARRRSCGLRSTTTPAVSRPAQTGRCWPSPARAVGPAC